MIGSNNKLFLSYRCESGTINWVQ